MIKGHGGNTVETARRMGKDPSEIVDMSSNVNPLGPPPGLVEFLENSIAAIESLPEADAGGIVRAFANRHGISPERVLAGNGTTQFIYAIPKVTGAKKTLILGPTYSDYADACKMNDAPFDFLMAKDLHGFRHDLNLLEKRLKDFDAVFVCNPNNPTGGLIPGVQIGKLVEKHPDVFFIVDESYLPFAPGGESETMIARRDPNLIVLNSMSKIYRIPGLRIGFVAADPSVIEKFYRYYLPWSVNALAQAAVEFLMERREETERFIEESRAYLAGQREAFAKDMQSCRSIEFFESKTSFLLAKINSRLTSGDVFEHMARKNFLIRDCGNFAGLSDKYIRISLKTRELNRQAAEKLIELFQPGGANRRP